MKLGVAFSGGGVKGAAHIGVLKAFEENNIPIEVVAGTSSGSIVASLYAMGYTAEEMLKLFQYFSKDIIKASPRYFINHVKNGKGIRLDGAFSSINVELALKQASEYKSINNITDLKIPIAIPAVDINTSKKYVFTNVKQEDYYYIQDIEIAKAVRASCSYPGVFEPFEWQEHRFVDGGVLDNIPADEVRKMGVDKVLAIKFVLGAKTKPKGMYGIVLKCMDTIFEGLAQQSLQFSDEVFNIDVSKASVFNTNQIEYCYKEGYQYAITKINAIRRMIAS